MMVIKMVFFFGSRINENSKPETDEALKQLRSEMQQRKSQFREMEECLPHKNG